MAPCEYNNIDYSSSADTGMLYQPRIDFFGRRRINVQPVVHHVHRGVPALKSLQEQDVYLDTPSGSNCGLNMSLMKLFSHIDSFDSDVDMGLHGTQFGGICSKLVASDLPNDEDIARDSNQNNPSESKSNTNLVSAKDSFSSCVDEIISETFHRLDNCGDNNAVNKKITLQDNLSTPLQSKPTILMKPCILDDELLGGNSLGELPLPVKCSKTFDVNSSESARHRLFGRMASAIGESRSKVASLYSNVSSFMTRSETPNSSKASILSKRLIRDTVMFMPQKSADTVPETPSKQAECSSTDNNCSSENVRYGLFGRMISSVGDPRSKMTRLYSNLSSFMKGKDIPKVPNSSILSKRLLKDTEISETSQSPGPSSEQNAARCNDNNNRDVSDGESDAVQSKFDPGKNEHVDSKECTLEDNRGSSFEPCVSCDRGDSVSIESLSSLPTTQEETSSTTLSPLKIPKSENATSKNENKNQNHQTSIFSLPPFRSLSSICMADNSKKQRHFLQARSDSADHMSTSKFKLSPYNTAYRLGQRKSATPPCGLYDFPYKNLDNYIFSQDEFNIASPSKFTPLVPTILATARTRRHTQANPTISFPSMMFKPCVRNVESGSLGNFHKLIGDGDANGRQWQYLKSHMPRSRLRRCRLHTVAEAKRFAPLASKNSS